MLKIKQRFQFLRLSFIFIIILVFTLLMPAFIAEAEESASGQGSFTIVPGISDIQVSDVTVSAATISWKTVAPATSQVFYDTGFHEEIVNYAYHTDEDTTLVTEHSVRLVKLSSGTTYHFRVRSVVDGIGVVSSDYTFTTQTYAEPGPGPSSSYYELIDFFGETSKWCISYDGRLLETVDITLEDGKTNIYIPKGTYCLDKDGNRLKELVIRIEEETPEPPENYFLVGKAYNFRPDGATFSPYLTITLPYDEDDIPEEVEEKDLFIVYYDSGWIPLTSAVDTTENKVSANIAHFTTFAIMMMVPPTQPLAPAEFAVSDLVISPVEVYVGEPVSIRILVTNIGGESGNCNVTLKINGVEEETKTVSIHSGLSREVTFDVLKMEAATYAVDVNGLTGSFTVKEKQVTPLLSTAFVVADLVISPEEVYVGQPVTIEVIVTNNGGEYGSYKIPFKIDGSIEETKEVTLAPGESQKVSLTVIRDDIGIYQVDVNDLIGSFTVKAKPEEVMPSKFNWSFWGGVIGGAILIAVVYILTRGRKEKNQNSIE